MPTFHYSMVSSLPPFLYPTLPPLIKDFCIVALNSFVR